MRPRYLEIEGLQSFKAVQIIDFDRLGEMGLFGIFGPTGSGKSTILDAVTLALYGNVQRAQNRTQGIMNTEVDIMRVLFAFELLKDNIRKNYRIERVYRRKKDSDISIEAKITRLFEVVDAGDIILADKQSEVNEAVIDLLGLQFDDFTRSVVLPQNKFREFLLSPKAEKTKMLERIFCLEEYGKQLTERVNRKLERIFCLEEYGKQLTERVNRKLGFVKYKLSTIEGAMAVLGDASGEALTEAAQNMKLAAENKDSADRELIELESRYNNLKGAWELTKELMDIESAMVEHFQQAEQYGRNKQLYDKSQKAESLVDNIRAYNNAAKSLEAAQSQLVEIGLRLPGLEKELAMSRELHIAAGIKVKQEIPMLVERKTKLKDAMSLTAEIEKLEVLLKKLRDDYISIKKSLEDTDREIEKNKAEVEALVKQYDECAKASESMRISPDYRKQLNNGIRSAESFERAAKEHLESKSKLAELVDRYKNIEEAAGAMLAEEKSLDAKLNNKRLEQQEHMKAIPGDKEQTLRMQSSWDRLKLTLDNLVKKKAENVEIEERHRVSENQLAAVVVDLNSAVTVRDELYKKLEQLKKQLDSGKAELEAHSAYELAKSLQYGTPCPVCGSTEHPTPAAADVGGELGELKKAMEMLAQKQESLQQELRSAENACIKFIEKHSYVKEQTAQLQMEHSTREKAFSIELRGLAEELGAADIDDLDEAGLELNKLMAASQEVLSLLEKWEAANRQRLQDISALENQLVEHRIECSRKTAEVKHIGDELATAEGVLKGLEAALADKERVYLEALRNLDIEDIHIEAERLENADRSLEELQKKLSVLQNTMEAARLNTQKLMEAKQQLSESFSEVRVEGESLKRDKEEKEKQLQKINPEGSAEKEIAAVDAAIKNLEEEEHSLLEKLKTLENAYNKALSECNSITKQVEIYTNALTEEKGRLEVLFAEKGFSGVAEAEKAVLSSEEQKRLSSELKAYEDIENKLTTRKAITEKKLDGHKVSEEEWQQISGLYEGAKLEKEKYIAAFEGAKNTYDTLKKNYDSWLQYNKDREFFTGKKDMLEQIKKLLMGNSFIEYISEERLRYIAKEASETLGVLTKFRYSLELDTENGFVIRDNANGGVIRLVSTLSGGETFLTSLSLALALSSHIQLKGQSPLEFFFLDEGFGTLDNSLLDTVVDSLERLSTTKRVIGLISHVPELKNRISRRLIVEQPILGGKGSQVRIEKA